MFCGHGGFQGCSRFSGTGSGCAVRLPTVPSRGVHVGSSKHGADVRVFRVLRAQTAHGIDEGGIPFLAVGYGIFVIEHIQGPDHVLLNRRAIVD